MKHYLIATVLMTAGLTACATTSVQELDKPKAERTKIASNMQEVKLTSSPVGASCTVTKGTETLATLASTPGFVTMKRSNFKDVDVTCSKAGFDTTTKVLNTVAMDNAIDGNIGAAFTLLKAVQGSLSSYEDSLFIKMDPSYFASSTARDNYLDDEISVMNSDFSTASEKYVKCTKKKCAKTLAKMQTNYDTRVAALKTKVAAIPVQ